MKLKYFEGEFMAKTVFMLSSIFDHILDFEFELLDFIQEEIRTPFLDFIFPLITRIGDSGIIWILIALLLFFFKKHRSAGLKLGAGIVLHVLVCNLLLKNVVQRIRPFYSNDMIQLLIPPPGEFSFPSGHSMSSFVAATILYGYHKTWGIIAYILAFLIAISRIYLYVHFPTDILFGAILGIILGMFVNRSKMVDGVIRKISGVA